MRFRANPLQQEWTVYINREEISSLVFACLYLLDNRDVKTQRVGGLIIMATDQYSLSPTDPVIVECKAFIDIIRHTKDKSKPEVLNDPRFTCQCKVATTNVGKSFTFGYGALGDNGQWQYPCTHHVAWDWDCKCISCRVSALSRKKIDL